MSAWTQLGYCTAVVAAIAGVLLPGAIGRRHVRSRRLDQALGIDPPTDPPPADQPADCPPGGDQSGDVLTSLANHNDRLIDDCGLMTDLPIRPASYGAPLRAEEQQGWNWVVEGYQRTAPEVTYQRTEQQP